MAYIAPDAINDRINRIPMGAMDYKYGIEVLKDKLSQFHCNTAG